MISVKKIKVLIVFLLNVVIFSSCYVDEVNELDEANRINEQKIQQYLQDNDLQATKTTSGLYYAITDESQAVGELIGEGDSVEVHFVAKLLSGTVVDSTSTFLNRTDKYIVDAIGQVYTGVNEGLKLMKENTQIKLIIPTGLALGASSTSRIPPYSVLVYDLKLVKARTIKEQIQSYLTTNNITPQDTTESGLMYKISEEGRANSKPTANESFIVLYTGKFPSTGQVFDSSLDSSFTLPQSLVVGFNEAARLLNEGGKGAFILPSKIAYGQRGNQAIPPFAPLVFELARPVSERTRIKDFLKANNITDTTRTNSGLYTRVNLAAPEANPKPKDTDSVQVSITAHYLLPDGTLSAPFRSNNLFNFRLNKTTNKDLIAGLKEGILLMRRNEKRELWIPSSLGFGTKGIATFPVPGKTPVYYLVELLTIF